MKRHTPPVSDRQRAENTLIDAIEAYANVVYHDDDSRVQEWDVLKAISALIEAVRAEPRGWNGGNLRRIRFN